ncbi:hypothetical protein EN925_27225 [Mesorhizobium sp. M7A.F.Ca.US.006.04.2.1]|nr:hypothetical protein EN990_20410 [Mesorhizobium sp. M7A.F.Ca.US.005.03.1.1]RUY18424.1 hypothetical protein EN991_04160 [Mesorhizobium sp. M7A.F.Ca.US.005.03.2.1]RVA02862.1 hypothetical protein EN938_17885 [Mesorhizobium sp. M7A.F.Ca.US.001.02.1.1]RVA13748.1 hypothetical protein EN932_07535 [Mesorhizobium sp. M7A.F.Ca.US.002.01.1.1]RVA85411.1 hypothetical protein EN925_27225 [Mesorhizobium sp. M7A.F.Ca.US.006.04.2.1]
MRDNPLRGVLGRARAKIFMKFLFLSTAPRLEPLWRSGPYSPHTAGSVVKDATGHFRYIAKSPVKFAKYKRTTGINTMDIAVIGIGILFFALCFAYIKACDAL